MKNWYSIKNRSSGVLDISLHDEIGLWGVSPKDFKNELMEHKNIKSINLSIHSPGGNMLDGIAMYNMLLSHPAKVFARVDGMAASAASLVLMSGNVIEMPENSFLMIHNPWGFVFGESEELRDHADLMDKFKETAINIYEAKSSLSRDEISEMMSNETWMDANEALEKGFIDTVIEPVEIAASINNFSRHFKTMPFEAKNKIESITSIKEYEKTLRDSGFSRSEANMMVSQLKAIIQSDSEELPEADLKELEAALMLMNVPKSLKN